MAGPGGRAVGRVSVRVLPDTSSFAASLEKYLQRTEKRLRLEIPVSLQAGDVARTEAELAAITKDRTVNIKTDVDTSAVDRIAKAFSGASSASGGGLGHVGLIAAAIAAALPALLALPSALVAIAAPIAVIAAGFAGIKEAAGGFLLALKVLGTATSKVFADILPQAFDKLEKLIPTLLGGFQTVAHAISVVFTDIVDAITSPQGLSAISDTFTNIGIAIFGLAPSFGQLTTLFLQLVDEGSKAMVNFLPALVTIIDKFVSLTNLLIDSGLLAKAFNTFNFLLGAALVAIGAVVIAGTLLAAGIDLITTAAANVIAALAAMVIWIASLPGKIGGALASLPGIIGGAFTTAWNAAKTATTTAIQAVVSLVGSIGGKVKSAVGDLRGVLLQAGKDVIQGLIDGIGAMFGKLKAKLGAVGSFIKAHKGPPSKDKVMLKPAGKWIMQGLIDGIALKQPALLSKLGAINSQLGSVGAAPAASFVSGIDGSAGIPASPVVLDGMVVGHLQVIAGQIVATKIADYDSQAAMASRGF